MVTIKFALVSLTLIVLFEAHNARHLHDASIKRSFDDGQSLFYGVVIQMVTGEKLRLPQSSRFSSLYDHHATYGRVNSPPAPPTVAPSKGQATYGRVNSSPPPPNAAPSIGQTTYGQVNSQPPPPNATPSKGQGTYGRVSSSPPPPNVAPTTGQETYTRVKSSPPPPIAPSKGQSTYGRVNPSPPSPIVAPSKGQDTYGRVNSSPPPPIEARPKIQPIYGRDKPSSKQDTSMEQAKYGRNDPRSPPSPDPNDSQRQGMYDRVNPSAPSTTKLADRKHPLLSDGVGLFTSNDDWWRLLPSYVTRVFKCWG